MIVYDGILQKLLDNGWTVYRLIKEKKIGNSTLTRIRRNASITTESIDTICELCNCQPSDIMHYEPSNKGE